jgi:cell division protease FtsH
MIKEYGMSSGLGQVYLSRERRSLFLDPGAREGGDYSDETARTIDREVMGIIDAQYAVAKDILQKRKDSLVRGAKLLLEKEKLDGEEIKALL